MKNTQTKKEQRRFVRRFKNCPAIYRIFNIKNGKSYVGQTRDMHKRAWHHVRTLQTGSHYNKHLLHSWEKYGAYCFIFGVLEYLPEECSNEKITSKEQHYMDKFKAVDKRYNILPKAELIDAQSEKWSGKRNPKWSCGEEISGSKNPMAILTEKEVEEIRFLLKTTSKSQESIGNRFSVARGTIKDINRGNSWSEIGDWSYPIRKGGTAGSKNGQACLDESNVKNIQYRLNQTDQSFKKIAKSRGVNRSTITMINRGYSWNHVGKWDYPIRDTHHGAKLCEEDVLEIRRLRREGSMTYKEIATNFPVTNTTIGEIIIRESWKHVD